MIQKLIIIILTLSCNVAPLFAEDNFIVIDKGRTEFVVDLNSLDSCKPHTIEKYVRNSLYEDSERGYFLIKQQFEIGDGCFEGYHPQNIFISV